MWSHTEYGRVMQLTKITTNKTQFLQHLSFFPIYHECVWYHECCMKQINLYLSIHIPYEQTHCIWAGTNNAKINSITGRAHLGHKRGHYQCLSVIQPLLTVLSYMPVVLNYISSGKQAIIIRFIYLEGKKKYVQSHMPPLQMPVWGYYSSHRPVHTTIVKQETLSLQWQQIKFCEMNCTSILASAVVAHETTHISSHFRATYI